MNNIELYIAAPTTYMVWRAGMEWTDSARLRRQVSFSFFKGTVTRDQISFKLFAERKSFGKSFTFLTELDNFKRYCHHYIFVAKAVYVCRHFHCIVSAQCW